MPELLFVYGTLRREHPQSESERLGEEAALIGFGHVAGEPLEGTPHPAIQEKEGSLVPGELYVVADQVLPQLDDYEGRGYYRKKTKVTMDDGTYAEAWVYYFGTAQEEPGA